MGIFPKDPGENKKYLKPSSSRILKQQKYQFAPWDWNIYLYIYHKSKLNVGSPHEALGMCLFPNKIHARWLIQAVTFLFPSWRSPTNCQKGHVFTIPKTSPAEFPGTNWSHRNSPFMDPDLKLYTILHTFWPGMGWTRRAFNRTDRTNRTPPTETPSRGGRKKPWVDLIASPKRLESRVLYPWITDGLTIGKIDSVFFHVTFLHFREDESFFVDPPSYTP